MKQSPSKSAFYGWWMLGGLSVFGAFTSATTWYGFTAYFRPLAEEFGWSYAAISFAAGIRGIEMGLADLFAGFLVDKFGGRKVILGGTLLMSVGFLLLSQMSSLATFYVYYLVLNVGVTGSASVVAMTLLSRWFRRRLGTAFGIYAAGIGLGGFLLPLVVYLVDTHGLRFTFVVFGVSVLFVGICVTLLVRDRPEPHGYGPDGDALASPNTALVGSASSESGGEASSHQAEAAGFKDVLHSRIFWTLVLVSIIQVFAIQMVTTHIMPYLESVGYSRYIAGQAAMAIPVISVLGRLGFGWLGDRFSRRNVLAMMMALQAVGVFTLAYARLPRLIPLFLLSYGLGYGGMMPNRAAILRDYFGIEGFGSMLGIVIGLSMIGGLVGPIMAGRIYDATGSYYLAFMLATGLLILGMLSLFSLKRPAAPPKM